MDGRTYAQMDGHFRPALLGRLCQRVDLKTWVTYFQRLSSGMDEEKTEGEPAHLETGIKH